jgi:hypothetical protein
MASWEKDVFPAAAKALKKEAESKPELWDDPPGFEAVEEVPEEELPPQLVRLSKPMEVHSNNAEAFFFIAAL